MALNKEFYIRNRQKFASELPPNMAVFLFSGEAVCITPNNESEFIPDRNFYYLTGIEQEGACLIITTPPRKASTEAFASGATSEAVSGALVGALAEDSVTYSEKLFVLSKDDMQERWHGKRLTLEEYSDISGISVSDICDMDDSFDEYCYQYLSKDASAWHIAVDKSSISKQASRFEQQVLAQANSDDNEPIDISKIIEKMRTIKASCEIEAIAKARNIVLQAFEKLELDGSSLRSEYDVYATLQSALITGGSMVQAFMTIAAVDENCFYLHHSRPEKDKMIKPDSIMQIDIGARVDGYCCDLSRVFFAKEIGVNQGAKEIDAIRMKRAEDLRILVDSLLDAAVDFIRPGVTLKELNMHMMELAEVWLKEQGLINELPNEEIKCYYWHNVAHHLGLETHDVGDREAPFEEGNVLAVEPGIYIPEWNVGFRVEDDVVVTSDGCCFVGDLYGDSADRKRDYRNR